ncbi:MAG: hypothetical protein MR598_00600 [Erysipelotrichaceae bacterium]|nr:hypothetical protein [Erysipelotrichaceae bacterium]
MKRKILKDIFDNLEQSLYSDMNIRIQHNLEDGKYREYLVKNVLTKVIPSKYSITNGFIIDSNNNISQEMDIIIYDKNYVPPFFEETYTVVPIEAVIAIIQVKTTLTKQALQDSIDNLNSINKLESKTGGKIISATGGLLTEKRFIAPYKIIVSYKTDYSDTHSFIDNMKYVDMLYIVEKGKTLTIKHRKNIDAIVNKDKNQLLEEQKNYNVEEIKDSRLAFFTLNLLEKMKLINNSIIINYEEYIKGAK